MPGIAPSPTSRRNRRHIRSSWAPVAASAISTSRASFRGVATRVSARPDGPVLLCSVVAQRETEPKIRKIVAALAAPAIGVSFAAWEAKMSNAVENEIVELERRYWQALRDGDADTTTTLSDDPCIVAGAQGIASLDRGAVANMMKQASWKLERFELDPEVQVRVIGDDVAVLAYKVREDLSVDGRSLKLEASDTSTWVRRDGRWVCAMHTEAIAGDPFGRDRRAAPGSG